MQQDPAGPGVAPSARQVGRLLAHALDPRLTDRLVIERRMFDDLAHPLRHGTSIAVVGSQPQAGRTTVAALLAHLLAVLGRTRVLAVDAGTNGTGLRERLGVGPAGSLHAVFAGLRLEPPGQLRLPPGPPSFRWVSQHLASDGGLAVLAAAANERGRPFPAGHYAATVSRLGRWYRAIVTDTPVGPTAEVLPGVIRGARRVLAVGTADESGLATLRDTLEWLAAAGSDDLLAGTTCVLVARGRGSRLSSGRARAVLGLPVHALPPDDHLASPVPLDWTMLSDRTRSAALALAAACVVGRIEKSVGERVDRV